MAVENALRFYKGWYGKGSNRNLPLDSHGIIFNEEEGMLFVNGKSYSGATDVTFENGVLTISYSDGRSSVTLDFNDTASAEATLKVFERIDNLIGPNVNVENGNGKLNYRGTNYIDDGDSDSDWTLVGADIALDAAIKNVEDKVDGLDASSVNAVTYSAATASTGASITFNNIKQVDGLISADDDTEHLDFALVATTGKAEDVAIDDSDNLFTATDVEGALAEIATEIDNMDATNVQSVEYTTASGNNGAKLTFKGISESDGVISQGSGTTELQFAKVATTGNASDVAYDTTTSQMENVTNVQAAIDNLDSRLKGQESLDTFDTVVSSDAATTPSGATWTDDSETVTGTLVASADTMHKIYLVPDTNESAEHTGTYNEYLTVRTGATPNYSYSWELVGSTKADLTGYVKTIVVNGKEYAVSNGTTQITLTDVITGITGESTTDLNNTDYVNVKATTTKDTTLGTDVTTLVSSVKTVDLANATSENNGLATALDVKTTINNTINGLDAELYSADSQDSNIEPIVVGVTQTNGLLTDVQVLTVGADVEYDTTNHTLTVGQQNGMVLGSDVTEIKNYIDYKSGASSNTVTNSNGTSDALVLTTSANSNGSTNYDINLVWSEWSNN